MTDALLGAAVGMVIGAAFVAVGVRAGIRYAAGLADARDDAPRASAVGAWGMGASIGLSVAWWWQAERERRP